MDEHIHDKQIENERALVPAGGGSSSKDASGEDATVPTKAIERVDGHEERKYISRSLAALRRQTPLPVTPTIDEVALRRTRVNRILMRKRHIDRKYSSNKTGLRFMIAAAVLFILFAMLVSGGTGSAYAYYQAQLPLLNGIAQHSLFQTTRIYDRNGKLLYELYDHQQDRGRRTYVNYNDISPLLVKATVATEDRTFWTNSGVDYNGVVRAALADLQHNGAVQGASTVTEQLVNNQFFNNQKGNIQVKGEEIVLATGLTQQYPKWKIMEMYLNTVYYGDLNYGVEAAAESYFRLQPQCSLGKCKPAVSQLDLAQASMLAGLPQSPSYYNPTTNKPVALQRQKVVLQAMLEQGMITKQQLTDAEAETAKFTFEPYSVTHHLQAPHFVNYVIDNVLAPMLGNRLADGGLNVYTTIDLDLEKQIEQIVYDKLYKQQSDNYLGVYGPLNITNNLNNAAVVVTNPKNGEILAMDGSANFNQNTPTMQGQDNAALALRQPGSSFKPIVYATAFEMGWYPAMIVPDHKTIYPAGCDGKVPPKCYSPQNYDGTFHTQYPMTIRTAVANSFNIPAVDAIEYAGVNNVVNMANRLGLSEIANLPAQRLVPSMAIGSDEVTPLDMTSAYATFANKGVREPQTSVLEITDNQGKLLYKYDEAHPKGVRALGADVSFLVSSMLSDKAARYHEFSPGNYLELDRPAAAKTGTTDSFKDNWTMGYTPYLAAGVWAGNSNNVEMTQNTIGITGAAPIWHDVMELASRKYNFPADDFAIPANVHRGVVSATTGLAPRAGEATVSDWFIDGTLPTTSGSGSYYTPPPTCTNFFCRPNGGQPTLPGPIQP
jgi:membrane peptidoglycan carboxypeptidase